MKTGGIFCLGHCIRRDLMCSRRIFIIRVNAHDGQDYTDDMEVAEAAIADGFEYFADYNGIDQKKTPTHMAYMWTWNTTMRTIAEMPDDTIVLYLIDDVLPIINFPSPRINGLITEILETDHHGDFRGLQCCTNIFAEQFRPFEPRVNDRIVREGWAGPCDYAIILNPPCARMLLDVFASHKFEIGSLFSIPRDVVRRGRTDHKFYRGLWHTIEDMFFHSKGFGSDIIFE